MAEPTEYKRTAFGGRYGNFLSIHSIVYDQFRTKPGSKFIQIKTDHAFFYVRSGCGKLQIRGKSHFLTAGYFFYIPPNLPVVLTPDKRDPWAYYVFHINDDFGGDFASLMGFTEENPTCKSKHVQYTDSIFDSLFTEEHTVAELFNLSSSALLQTLAIMRSKSGESDNTPKNTDTVQRIKDIIELNYKSADFSIDIIPKMMYISHTHICRLFKAETGITPVAYLADLRLNYSAELLQEQNMSVRQLSEASGFSDELYFMKCFKKKFGMTVREYRNKRETN